MLETLIDNYCACVVASIAPCHNEDLLVGRRVELEIGVSTIALSQVRKRLPSQISNVTPTGHIAIFLQCSSSSLYKATVPCRS